MTIAFLKSHKPDYTEKDFDKFRKMVWRNIREENPSMRLTKGGYQFLKKNTSDLRPTNFVKMLLPFTGLSIFFLIIFYIGIVIGFLNISTFLFLIIGISVITLPHVFIMANFYNSKVQ